MPMIPPPLVGGGKVLEHGPGMGRSAQPPCFSRARLIKQINPSKNHSQPGSPALRSIPKRQVYRAQRIKPIRKEAARPKGMVRRRILPSNPRAPHMGAAMAILKGEEMEPSEAPTTRPAFR